jgi:hypothetical protein
MPSTWYVVTYEELCTHKCMQLHAKAKNANSCSSPWYKPTNSGTCSALCVQTPAIVRRYIHSLWCLLTQADTWHDQPKSMLICAKSWADAYTCRHTQSPQWMARCQDTNTTPYARQPCSAFNTGQLVLVHAELLIRAETCTRIPGSRIVKTHTNTCSALDTGQYMLRNHDWIFMSAEICRITLSSWCWPTHNDTSRPDPDTNQHMQVHAKLLVHVETCERWYWPTFVFIYYNKDSPSALDKCRKMQKDARLSTGANRLSALNTFKHMQPHSQPSMRAYMLRHVKLIRADTCTHALHSWYRQTNTDTRSALNMCRHTLSSRGTGRQALSFQHRKLNEDASSALDTWSLSVHKDDPGSQ